MYLTLVPAYSRDYSSKKEVQADWDAGKDFQICDISSRFDGAYINKADATPGTYNIRYKRLTMIHPIKVSETKAA